MTPVNYSTHRYSEHTCHLVKVLSSHTVVWNTTLSVFLVLLLSFCCLNCTTANTTRTLAAWQAPHLHFSGGCLRIWWEKKRQTFLQSQSFPGWFFKFKLHVVPTGAQKCWEMLDQFLISLFSIRFLHFDVSNHKTYLNIRQRHHNEMQNAVFKWNVLFLREKKES